MCLSITLLDFVKMTRDGNFVKLQYSELKEDMVDDVHDWHRDENATDTSVLIGPGQLGPLIHPWR